MERKNDFPTKIYNNIINKKKILHEFNKSNNNINKNNFGLTFRFVINKNFFSDSYNLDVFGVKTLRSLKNFPIAKKYEMKSEGNKKKQKKILFFLCLSLASTCKSIFPA